MKHEEGPREFDLGQVTADDIHKSDRFAHFRSWHGTRRDFLKLAGTAAAVAVFGDGRPAINEALALPIAIEFQVDERLRAKRELTAVSFNKNFPNPNKLLRDAWWDTARAAWQRTNRGKISHDEYNDMVKQAAATGDHTPLMFSVGGTDKTKSSYNMSTFEIDPLRGTRVLVVDDGVYGGQFLGMQFDEVRAAYAPDDKHGQSKVTETTRKQFGFAKDKGGQLVMMFNWDPSGFSGETRSTQLTEGFTDALALLAYRNPGIHNVSYLPGTPEEEMAFFRQTGASYRSLFGFDSQGDRIGLLTAPEFNK